VEARENAAALAVLDSIREYFGWAYGSHWKVDPAVNALRFATESGSAGGARTPAGGRSTTSSVLARLNRHAS